MIATSIQISGNLQQELLKRKLFDSETYEEVIWDMVTSMSINGRMIHKILLFVWMNPQSS